MAYGVRLGARAAGLSQAANGCGKALGPLCLALIAGTDNLVSPRATADAVTPACTFLVPETSGRPISLEAVESPTRAAQ
jgi:MFS transporter, putative metabolite:H+ symporter